MSPRGRRYSLKSSDAKPLLSKASEKLGVNLVKLIGSKATIEAVETGHGEVLLLGRKPLLFRIKEDVYPTLVFEEALDKLPKVVVDMGAVRHVCNGASVMAPGIVRYDGEFARGSLVVVVDVKHGKPLALGEAQYDAEAARSIKQGIVIKNIHYVSDEIWDSIKMLTD
jgi:PUA-domain protein